MIWVGNTKFLDNTKMEFEEALPEEKQNWATYWQKKITWNSQGDATPFINLHPMPDTVEGDIHRKVREIWLKARADSVFAMSNDEVEKILDNAHEQSMDSGFQTYLDYITDKWHENRRKLEGE